MSRPGLGIVREVAPAFPRIIRFRGTDDAPGASCPHCGAEGRWIIRFTVEGPDGKPVDRAAMRGCVKLFPVSRIALEELRLRDKAEKYAKQGWSLNRGDTHALEQIEAFYAGTVTERAALAIVDSSKAANMLRARRGR